MRPILLLGLFSAVGQSQWLNYPTPGIPRTSDGKPVLTAPVPRAPDGKPDLSGTWSTPSVRYYSNVAADLKTEDVKPWAEALHGERVRNFSKDSMESQCLPLGPAAMTGPYRSFQFLQTPALVAILFDDLTYRQIFLDGRQLEKDPNPTWMGYSVGHWEGDSLVVESNGYTSRVWLDFDGHPHSEDLRITERIRRIDVGHMEMRMTLDDPKNYARPWTVTIPMELLVDTSMLEAVCTENEKDRSHMEAKGPEIHEAPIAETTLARYVGVYDFVDDGRPHAAEITAADGSLYWNQDGAGRERLWPFSETSFSLSGTVVEFVPHAGPATQFLMQWAEGEIKGTRRK